MRSLIQLKGGKAQEIKGEVVREQPLVIYVDGQKFVTLLCSPVKLDCLVLGYLWLEKVIASLDDVARLEVSEVDGRADVTLTREVELPTERILTSGCGGGITFRIDPRLFPRIHSSLRVWPEQLFQRMKELYAAAENYRKLRAAGYTVRKTIDCLIGTFCLQQGHSLLHNDRDFDPFERVLGMRVIKVA